MKKKLLVLFFCLELIMLIFLSVRGARATLGEPVDSVESDRKMLSAAKVTSKPLSAAHANYTVYQLEYGGTSVREYASSSGVVFGIAWNGLVHPDLTPLLGTYASEYQEALAQTARRYGERHLEVKAAHVIVQKWGHMRNLQGRAYAPALIPAGVSIHEIK
ncbi:MAG TPA: DUF2844 domain-containing protein [Thermodesulfobacteriota bacterium]|nr:DUF2844 domain-containing protein [Thermodesulfobacteriota bacterium]